MLTIENLSVAIGQRKLIQGLSFSLEKREVLAVFGPSGSGKSTLLNAIAGFIPVTENGRKGARMVRRRWFANDVDRLEATGDILFDDKSLSRSAPADRPLGLVLQKNGIYPHLTAFENIAFPMRCQKRSGPEIRSEVSRLAALVDLPPSRLDQRARSLSAGEGQRVAIAKMLAKGAQVGLLDEPFSSLDQIRRTDLLRLIRSLVDDVSSHSMNSVFMISHDWREVNIADKVILMNARQDRPSIRVFSVDRKTRRLTESSATNASEMDQSEERWYAGLVSAIEPAL